MNDETNYKNNPLHGLSLKNLLIEMVGYYGFDILFAYLNINCFKTNPSIDASVKFLKKTDWAREKVESFYLYEFKNLPRATNEQFQLPPRDRIVPEDQTPGEPAELSLEDAERLNKKRAQKAAEYNSRPKKSYGAPRSNRPSNNREHQRPQRNDREPSNSSSAPPDSGADPWASWKK